MAQIIILTGTTYQPETEPRVQRTLGAYRVASALLQSGYTVQVIDYIQYMSSQELMNVISKHLGPETLWVGYSSTFFGYFGSFGYKNSSEITPLEKMYSANVNNIEVVYDYIKKNSNAKIVYGGAYVLGMKSDPRVDYYVLGYSDVSAVKLSDFLSKKIQNLEGLSTLPIGSYLLDSSKYEEPKMNDIKTNWESDSFLLLPGEPISLEFARGCIFKCKFCNYPLLGKKKGTYIRDMEEVRDELTKLWETKGTDTFYITDDTFNDDNDKMENFHKLFTSLPFKPKFATFLRIDLMDRFPHQADLLLEAGLVGAFFGVESFNHQSARAIGKGLHPDKVKKRLAWVKDKWNNKVSIGAGLIIGLPYDDDKYFQELYEYVTSKDYPIDHTSFSPLYIHDPKKGLNSYSSEFSLKPEIYGYSFDDQGNWYHENGLTYNIASNIAMQFRNIKNDTDKAGDFQVIPHLALGIPLNDILTMSYNDLYAKHDMAKLNKQKIDSYKNLIGAL
jgi:radical SAM superfamily enzyme YgiQ (UPF0313 family)